MNKSALFLPGHRPARPRPGLLALAAVLLLVAAAAAGAAATLILLRVA